MAREIPGLQRQWQTNVTLQANLPVRQLTWPDAVGMLQAGNLKLLQAHIEVTNSQENYYQVYKDLLPSLDLHGSASHTFDNLSAFSFHDLTFNIDSFLNFPGIASMASRLFVTKLTFFRAMTVAQLAEREQTLELYKLFLASQEAEEMAQDLQADQNIADHIRPLDEFTAAALSGEIKTRRILQQKNREQLQTKASELFGRKDFLWAFNTNGWPVLDYDRQPLPLTDTNHVAQLQIRLLAIELVGSWATLQGIKLQYWPELSLYISGPPVYYHDRNGEGFWDAHQVRATADLFWRLDTRGNITRQLRQTRREQELEKARLHLETINLISRIVNAQKIAASLREQLSHLEALALLQGKVPPPREFSAYLSAMEASRSLREQERHLRRELAEVNALSWFVDDSKWPDTPLKSP